MSWVSLAHVTPCRQPEMTRLPAILPAGMRTPITLTSLITTQGERGGSERIRSLGAARAGTTWRWATSGARATGTHQAPATEISAIPISIPVRLLGAMRAAAHAAGQSESEVWAEAAREWLRQRQHDNGPLPPTPAAAALAVPRRARSWSAVDAVLTDLRGGKHAMPGAPAA